MTGSSKRPRRLLGSDDIERGLGEVASIAAQEGLPVLLIGGVALHYYGSERLTVDLDIVAQAPLPPGLEDEGPLGFGGSKTHTPSGVPLDWIARTDDFSTVFDEALNYGRRFEGVPVPVASPEYLAAMKLLAGRDKDNLDLLTLLQSGEVDLPKARRIIKRLLGAYAAKDFDTRVAEAEWRAARRADD